MANSTNIQVSTTQVTDACAMQPCGIKRVITLNEPIQYKSVRVFDDNGADVTSQSLYSWSADGVCWTNWTTIDQYERTARYLETDFFLRIKICGGFSKLTLDDYITTCYSIQLDSANTFLQQFCANANLFSPYTNLDCALLLQQQLSDSIICMLGIPIYYFKVSQTEESRDFTFKEYVLQEVESVKQLKLMLTDGQMPSSKPNFSEFDFDWETDWEVELSKTQFAAAFGDTAFPSNHDFIYIPMMKRMWAVNDAYDEKNEGLLWRSTTWKLALVKFNEKTNVNTEGFEDIIDPLIINKYEEVFGRHEHIEQERHSGTLETRTPRYVADSLYDVYQTDGIRKSISSVGVKIDTAQLNQYSAILARNKYRFAEGGAVVYQRPYCGDSGSLTLTITTPNMLTEGKRLIFSAGDVCVYFGADANAEQYVEFNGMTQTLAPGETYICMFRWSRANFTTEMNILRYAVPVGVPAYRIRPEMCGFDVNEPVCELTAAYNDDYDVGSRAQEIVLTGYPLDVYAVRMYNCALDAQEHAKESFKYVTTNEHCLFADLARPIDAGIGFPVR